MTDTDYLKIAIQNSIRSMEEENFPAGAIVVQNNEIIASEISSPFPNLFHADSKAISTAFKQYGSLKNSTLYIGLESCLMCSSIAYWSGLRRVVYAIEKSKVNTLYYETAMDTTSIIKNFHETIEFIHIAELEEEALSIVRKWEKKFIK